MRVLFDQFRHLQFDPNFGPRLILQTSLEIREPEFKKYRITFEGFGIERQLRFDR